MKDKKVVFIGTPYFACKVLERLIKETNVIGVVTQPDKEVGRKKVKTFSMVKEMALKNNIKVFDPIRIKDSVDEINALGADIYITAAYGQMLPEELFNFPKYKTINVHGSLLPKLRGGAPIQRAIINGDNKTGITIMKVEKGMDSGDIFLKQEIIIEDEYNYSVLNEKLADIGSSLLIEALDLIFKEEAVFKKQDEEKVSFAPIITRADEFINFNKTAKEVFNQIRGLSLEPGAYFLLDGKVIKVYDSYIGEDIDNEPGTISNIYKNGIGISTVDKEIILTKLKPEGKKMMDARDFLNGINKEKLINQKII